MNTTLAYFRSPADGNLYPTYVYLQEGHVALVHFVRNGSELTMAYYPVSGLNSFPSAPVQIDYQVQNGLSNIVYYQPKLYGQSELLFCTTFDGFKTQLFCNPQAGLFELVIISQGAPGLLPAGSSLKLEWLQEQYAPSLPVQKNPNIPEEILSALQALQYGQLSNVSSNVDKYRLHITAEDSSGDRFVVEKFSNNGITKKTVTEVKSFDNKQERLLKVVQLHNEGLTQMQIANHLGVSQKTVSNDLKELNFFSK